MRLVSYSPLMAEHLTYVKSKSHAYTYRKEDKRVSRPGKYRFMPRQEHLTNLLRLSHHSLSFLPFRRELFSRDHAGKNEPNLVSFDTYNV
jgi:hypothetical protein